MQNSTNASSTSLRLTRRLQVLTEPTRGVDKVLQTRTLSDMVFMSPRNSPRVTPRSNRLEMDIEVSSNFTDKNNYEVDILKSEEDSKRPATASNPHDVGSVIDMLFEMHTALKTKHAGLTRTAASALAASNLVSKIEITDVKVTRDEQIETLENIRSTLECSICQDVFTNATESTCCGQIYCKDCIERWVSENENCPMCRTDIPTPKKMLRSARHAQRMANEIIIQCNWCDATMKKASLESHLANVCENAPVEPLPALEIRLRLAMVKSARASLVNLRRFVTSPTPAQAGMTQCYIQTRGNTYSLYTTEGDVLLMVATRKRQLARSPVIFLVNAAKSTGAEGTDESTDNTLVGTLKRNFVGSDYSIIGNTASSSDPADLGAIQYAPTLGKTPRQMRVAVPTVQETESSFDLVSSEVASDLETSELETLQSYTQRTTAAGSGAMALQIEAPNAEESVTLINKPPVWIESLEAYCLDFGGRVTEASVKNFLLSTPDDMDTTMMLFGRTNDRSVYSMDYRHPLSPLQAFCIALSSMDSHLVTFD